MFNIYNFKNRNNKETEENFFTKKFVEKPSSFTKYEDPNQEFSSKELQVSLWYLKNKSLLYKVAAIVLMVINAVMIGFSLWKWGVFFVEYASFKNNEAHLAASINYTNINTHFAAQPVQIIRTQVFSGRGDSYDVVAELVNPNERFLVWFDYYFIINGKKTNVQKTFLLPGESRFVPMLGVKELGNGAPTLVLENNTYERISNRLVADVPAWQRYRLNFSVSDFVFSKSLAQEGNNVDAVQFSFTNNSPYNYIAPDFYLALLQNDQLVGMLPFHLERINSLETKKIDLRSFVPNLAVTGVAVYPLINIYDATVYAP
jgi:hypothetical protein